MNDIHSLLHKKWNCKYHVVFAPKYRRKVFYVTKFLNVGFGGFIDCNPIMYS